MLYVLLVNLVLYTLYYAEEGHLLIYLFVLFFLIFLITLC